MSARSPSLFGMTVYKEVMSIVKINLFSPEKVKSRKICSAWLVSLMWDGKDLTKGTIILSKQLEISSVGQLQAETMGRPGLFGLWILGLK